MRHAIVRLLQILRINRAAHRLYYRYIHGFQPGQREVIDALPEAFAAAAEKGLLQKGDYYEFGLFKGYSFWTAQKTAAGLGLESMRFFGFDSFQGLPDIGHVDKTPHQEFYKGQYYCGKKQVIKNLDSQGVDWDRTYLIEGYFNKSLTPDLKKSYRMKPVAIALIDCDLYTSTVDVLNFLEDLLMDGSILMFDDWNCFNKDNSKGQRRAFREFLEKHSDIKAKPFFNYGSYGQVFIISVERVALQRGFEELSLDGAGFEPATLRM